MKLSRRHMKPFFGLLALLACMACASACHAQLGMTMDTGAVDFGTLSKSDLDAGFMELTSSASTYALRVSVTDTLPENWTLYTKTSASSFSANAGVKPCSDLQWRLNDSGNYTEYSVFDVPAAAGSGDATVDFDFKMLTSWFDRPGTYAINIIYTISN
jgi:hypothetical protein